MTTQSIIELYSETAKACKQCADYCLAASNVKPFEAVIVTSRDTAVFLWVLGALVECKSPFLGSFSLFCADACSCTADACEKFQDVEIQLCAKTCRKSAVAAREMAESSIDSRLISFGN